MYPLSSRLTAEALGTFGLIFIGCSSVLVNPLPSASYGLLGIALAHALVLAIGITATMNISGGHLNPAVTLGLLAGRRVDIKTAVSYIGAQLVGAAIAALLVKGLLPHSLTAGTTLGAPALAPDVSLGQGIAIEAVLTFFLVSAVYGTAVSPDAPKVGGFGIGLVLLFDILVGGPLTGAAMNPARAFGPQLVSGRFIAGIVWWIGPILGGLVAGVLWSMVLLKKK
jgi:aquaporin Z